MVSVYLPSDALLQHLPSYLGFCYLGHGLSLHGCSSKAQPLLLTLDEGYLLTAAPPDLERGIAPLGPPALAQPLLLGCGAAPPGRGPWPRVGGSSSQQLLLLCCSLALSPPPLTLDTRYLLSAAAPDLGRGVGPPGHCPWPRSWGSSSWPFLRRRSLALSAAAPDLGRGVTPLGRSPSGMGSSRLLPLASDVG